MIYFIREKDGDAIKIGYVKDKRGVGQRLQTLQVACREPLEITGVIGGSRRLEVALHKYFAGCRIRGEWFRATDELLAVALGRKKIETILPDAALQEAALSLRLPPALHEAIRDKANESGLSVSQFVRQALHDEQNSDVTTHSRYEGDRKACVSISMEVGRAQLLRDLSVQHGETSFSAYVCRLLDGAMAEETSDESHVLIEMEINLIQDIANSAEENGEDFSEATTRLIKQGRQPLIASLIGEQLMPL